MSNRGLHQILQDAFRLHSNGKLAEAELRYKSILDIDSRNFNALHLLGVVRLQQRRAGDAVKLIGKALESNPNSAEARSNLGSAYIGLGRYEEAVSSCRQAVRLKPDYPDALDNLGLGLQGLRRYDEAMRFHREALGINPQHPGAHNNLGLALETVGRQEEALALYVRATELKPGFADALCNAGNALQSLGRYPDAIAWYAKAITAAPGHAEAHWHAGLAHLITGDFPAGWREYEWRWRTRQFESEQRVLRGRRWSGTEDLGGKRILLHAEQGFGDTIQFARYATLVADRGAQVVLEVQPPLARLLGSISGVSVVAARGAALPFYDFRCPLLSLPGLLGTTIDTIPASVPYVRPPAGRQGAWHDRLAATSGMTVGLVWFGSSTHRNDLNRSIALRALEPLLSVPSVDFVTLQPDLRDGDLEYLRGRANVSHVGELFSDFADTASAISQLDLVITVDTAVAHLAGAMAKPTWLLLPFAPDWRWLLGREDSPWYPGMRLFRQSKAGDWETVIREVAGHLTRFAR